MYSMIKILIVYTDVRGSGAVQVFVGQGEKVFDAVMYFYLWLMQRHGIIHVPVPVREKNNILKKIYN